MGVRGTNSAPATHVGRGRPTPSATTAALPSHPIGFAEVLRIRVFAVLYVAEIQSIVGDQLARVALSVLVFDRTGSATATAATYAATLLPAVLGGVLLSHVGDRLPRRLVMAAVDSIRATCFVLMAVSAVPLSVVVVLLVAAVAIGPVFSASEVSYLAAALTPDQFRLATATRMMSSQVAQVAGFLFGGIAVAALGPHPALLLDAVTFVISVIAVVGVLPGPIVAAPAPPSQPAASDATTGTSVVNGSAADGESHGAASAARPEDAPFVGLFRTPRVRRALALSCLVGFFVVPEGLAVPFGASVGAGTAAVGVLLGAGALGGGLGAVVLARLVSPPRRERAAEVMAMLCGLPLVLPLLHPSWPVAAACWFLSGSLAAYLVEVTATLVQAIPDRSRAKYVGVAGALLLSAQGAGLLAFGALAELVAPVSSIAIAGIVGSLLAASIVLGGTRRDAEAGLPAVTHADDAAGSNAARSGRHRAG